MHHKRLLRSCWNHHLPGHIARINVRLNYSFDRIPDEKHHFLLIKATSPDERSVI